jgi:hypothetical protein
MSTLECDFCHESKNKVWGITRCCGQWTCVLCNSETLDGCGRCEPMKTIDPQKNMNELFQKCNTKTQIIFDKLNHIIKLFDEWLVLYPDDKLRLKSKECLISDREKYETRLKRCQQVIEFSQHPELFQHLMLQFTLTINEWINEPELDLSIYQDMVIFKPFTCFIFKVDKISQESSDKTTYTSYSVIDTVMSEWIPFQCNFKKVDGYIKEVYPSKNDFFINILVDYFGTCYQIFRHKNIDKDKVYPLKSKNILFVSDNKGNWGEQTPLK